MQLLVYVNFAAEGWHTVRYPESKLYLAPICKNDFLFFIVFLVEILEKATPWRRSRRSFDTRDQYYETNFCHNTTALKLRQGLNALFYAQNALESANYTIKMKMTYPLLGVNMFQASKLRITLNYASKSCRNFSAVI